MAGIADSKVGKLVRHLVGAALSPVRSGEDKIASKNPNTAAPSTLHITCDGFADGQPIPLRYASNKSGGENVSPGLAWSGVPGNTRELVLIVQDPDAPFPQPFVHWILHRLPPSVNQLPTGVPTTRELPQFGGAVQGVNDAKQPGYYGPEPPHGHGVHHYHFQLFAVDTQLNLSPDATVEDLVKAMKGHVLAEGQVVGTYERRAM